MPKMKTKSGAKKRFKLTAKGKVKAGHQIRNLRGTRTLKECDARTIRKKYLPNG